MARKRAKRTECPNCGRSLLEADNYCPRCGQENHTHKLPVRHFVVELLSGLFNFDTKLLRTLRDLFWPPGLVIREFNANRRVRYVPPLRLYLFTSVLFFILLAWTTDRLEIGADDVVAVNEPRNGEANTQGLTLNFGGDTELTDSTLNALSMRPVITNASIDSALTSAGIGSGFWTRAAVRMGINARAGSNRKAAYVQNIFSMFSKLMFILLPLFALLLLVLHLGSGRYYSEHLVFALYFHTVLFLLIGMRLLLGQFIDMGSASILFLLFAVFHLLWSIRVVYRSSWWRTILRTTLLVFLYFILLVLGFGTAAVMGAMDL